MATHSSVLAWRIPGMGEPGGLPSMGFHRVGHDWSNLAVAAAGKPGMLQSMGSRRVGHNWATELNWTESVPIFIRYFTLEIALCLLKWCVSYNFWTSKFKLGSFQMLSSHMWLVAIILDEAFSESHVKIPKKLNGKFLPSDGITHMYGGD